MPEFVFRNLVEFLHQSHRAEKTMKGNQSTAHYPKDFRGLRTKLSVGFGAHNDVPWIAFSKDIKNIKTGFYPVFLYYAKKGILVLSYGVGDKRKNDLGWAFSNNQMPVSISDFMTSSGLGKPDKYGTSLVFKSYKINREDTETLGLKETEVMKDLDTIIAEYNAQFAVDPPPPPRPPEKFSVSAFVSSATEANYRVSESLARRFIAALATKPFVILTGLSGSGKTKLAQVFARWICASSQQYILVPVGADWTNREPLLGYPNALDPEEYVFPESGVLGLMLEASKAENHNKPYFLILDEMNMSHVERYFADFLSAMESGEPIPLHSRNITYPPRGVNLPPNLFIIGTVNVDETTYMFSPKVLDRANVIEFRVDAEDMKGYLSSATHQKIDMKLGTGQEFSAAFMALRESDGSESSIRDQLMIFFLELKKIGAEFGYRSAAEINRFHALMKKLDPGLGDNEILDCAILEKLLPKVHGSRRKLETVLKKLIELSVENQEIIDDLIAKKIEYMDPKVGAFYPQSVEKILRMYWGMLDNGFTSFTEA